MCNLRSGGGNVQKGSLKNTQVKFNIFQQSVKIVLLGQLNSPG